MSEQDHLSGISVPRKSFESQIDRKEQIDLAIEELKMVQDIIKRMAGNSFLLKGWTVTLVVATFLFKLETKVWYHFLLAIIPTLFFWYLDAFFLRQERMYRKLHDWIKDNRVTTNDSLFDMNATRFSDQVDSTLNTATSSTIFWFYFSIMVLVLGFAYIICINGRGI